MKRLAAIILAGTLAMGSFSTVGAAEFSDGRNARTEMYFDDNFEHSYSAGDDLTSAIEENRGVDVKDSIVMGFENALVFYPNTFYDFKVIGAGTQNAAPVSGDVRWIPLYWSMSSNPQENGKFMTWKIGAVKGIYTEQERAYDIFVFFRKEIYTGEVWEMQDDVESARYQFRAAPLTDKNENTYSIGGINYKISEKKEASVTGLAQNLSVVQIPSTVSINGTSYKVTTVEQKAFCRNKEITNVVIGNNVTNIDKYAFYQCTNLKTVRFGRKVSQIGNNAFAQCRNLRSFSLPASLKRIGVTAFCKCASVKTVKINSTALESVGQRGLAVNNAVTLKLPKRLFAKYQKMIKTSRVYSKTRFVKF